ncbi:MAG: aldo/keto reductase, partial [Candidatus Goldbacteria bacterium]|nr:aldo/keto reductase [Candidatus Goldiibacteriota bacterium]
DIYYFHHGDFGEQDRYLHGAVDVMYKLKKQGKIRAIGFSAYSQNDFLRLTDEINPDVLQSWANIFDTQFIDKESKVAKMMKEKNITFVAFSPLAKGLLLGKYSSKNPPKFPNGDHRRNDEKFQREFLEEIEPKIEKLKQRFGRLSRDLARVALQYILSFDCVSCVIPGFRNKDQVEINLWGWDKKLTEDDIIYIKEVFK